MGRDSTRKGFVKNLLAVVEIRTKWVSVSSFLLGTLFALRTLSLGGTDRFGVGGVGSFAGSARFSKVELWSALLMFLSTLCVDMGTTAWNTYFDFLRGTDDPRINREPDKVLIHGNLPPAFAFWTAFWLYGVALLGGLLLSFRVGLWVLPVGALCMGVGFFYNAGPLPISHTPVGELFAGGFLGSVLFLISWGVQVAAGARMGGASVFPLLCPSVAPLAREAMLASLPSGLAVASILAVNNTCDTEGDREGGRKTFAVLVGKKAGALLAATLACSASLGGMALSAAGLLSTWGLGSFGGAFLYTVVQFFRMGKRGFSHPTKSRNMGAILGSFKVWTLAYLVALL